MWPTGSPQVTARRRAADFADAEWTAGWLALRFVGDAAAATRHFQRLCECVRTPVSRARADYWLGPRRRGPQATRRSPTLVCRGQQLRHDLLRPARRGRARAWPCRPTWSSRRRHRRRRPSARTPWAGHLRLLCELGEFDRAAPFAVKLGGRCVGDARRRCHSRRGPQLPAGGHPRPRRQGGRRPISPWTCARATLCPTSHVDGPGR